MEGATETMVNCRFARISLTRGLRRDCKKSAMGLQVNGTGRSLEGRLAGLYPSTQFGRQRLTVAIAILPTS